MSTSINNAFYDELHHEWYVAKDHPIVLLRAENRVRNPWILSQLKEKSTVLDIGCGGGFLTNKLAKAGHQVTGVDLSFPSLEIAKKQDATASVAYYEADAYSLPFEENEFDAVCAMDLLEHVKEPWRVIEEAARVLRPGGLFFFHTFNRTALSYIVAIKGVEWFVRNVPQAMHLHRYFIKPKELNRYCSEVGLVVKQLRGLNPVINRALFKLVFTRHLSDDFAFKFSKSLACGYVGMAINN